MNARSLYTGILHGVREVISDTSLMARWDAKANESKLWLWSRSLLSIHDLEDLIRLDTPWWTFRSVEIVESFLHSRPAPRVFEWGSGASTVWLASRSAFVYSIEHDPNWIDAVDRVVPDNTSLRLVRPRSSAHSAPEISSKRRGHRGLDFSNYVTAIEDAGGSFDLIVIDGRAREACLPYAMRHLAQGGRIVFDNVERSRYRAALDSVRTSTTVLYTSGLTPCLPYPTQTAIVGLREGLESRGSED